MDSTKVGIDDYRAQADPVAKEGEQEVLVRITYVPRGKLRGPRDEVALPD